MMQHGVRMRWLVTLVFASIGAACGDNFNARSDAFSDASSPPLDATLDAAGDAAVCSADGGGGSSCDPDHPCGLGQLCCGGTCVSGSCCSTSDCAGQADPQARACDATVHTCGACGANALCAAGATCCGGACIVAPGDHSVPLWGECCTSDDCQPNTCYNDVCVECLGGRSPCGNVSGYNTAADLYADHPFRHIMPGVIADRLAWRGPDLIARAWLADSGSSSLVSPLGE